jgi:hypothetical protein
MVSQFDLGMICAAGIVFHSFGDDVEAFEILKATHADKIDPMEVDEFDRDVLLSYRDYVKEQAAYWRLRNRQIRKNAKLSVSNGTGPTVGP